MQTLERARWAGSKHGYCRWLAGVLGEQKVGWQSTAKGRGMTPETRGTRPPGGNDLVELGLGRSIGHKRVPRGRRGETRYRVALDVHYGNGQGQDSKQYVRGGGGGCTARDGGDAVEMGVGLESFEKACHCFWPFQCLSRMSGRAHIHNGGWVTGWTGRGRGLWEMGGGKLSEGEGADPARGAKP